MLPRQYQPAHVERLVLPCECVAVGRGARDVDPIDDAIVCRCGCCCRLLQQRIDGRERRRCDRTARRQRAHRDRRTFGSGRRSNAFHLVCARERGAGGCKGSRARRVGIDWDCARGLHRPVGAPESAVVGTYRSRLRMGRHARPKTTLYGLERFSVGTNFVSSVFDESVAATQHVDMRAAHRGQRTDAAAVANCASIDVGGRRGVFCFSRQVGNARHAASKIEMGGSKAELQHQKEGGEAVHQLSAGVDTFGAVCVRTTLSKGTNDDFRFWGGVPRGYHRDPYGAPPRGQVQHGVEMKRVKCPLTAPN